MFDTIESLIDQVIQDRKVVDTVLDLYIEERLDFSTTELIEIIRKYVEILGLDTVSTLYFSVRLDFETEPLYFHEFTEEERKAVKFWTDDYKLRVEIHRRLNDVIQSTKAQLREFLQVSTLLDTEDFKRLPIEGSHMRVSNNQYYKLKHGAE